MVQNVGMQQNPMGAINRVGMTQEGRVIYQVLDGTGQVAGKLSVNPNQCDVFEKSYNDIMESAPKIQKFAQKNSSPEDMKKRKKAANWTLGLTTAAGVIVPIILTRKFVGKWATLKQVLATLGGTVAGLAGGIGLSLAISTPPGTMKFAKASQKLSKLDIQPYTEA